jgi:aminomethyltransferase
MLTKHAVDAYYMVTNAGRRERDLSWIREKLGEWNASEKGKEGPVEMEVMDGWGLLAIQGSFSVLPRLFFAVFDIRHCCTGPQVASYLQGLTSYDLRQLTFGRSAYVSIEGFNLHLSRGGYTGEDGFEVRPEYFFVI